MAMDLPRSLGFGMLGILCATIVWAQDEEYTVSSSESSYRQNNGDLAVPTEEALDAYAAGTDASNSMTFDDESLEFDLSEAQALWDSRYPEPEHSVPMAPPVDESFNPARDHRPIRQAGYEFVEEEPVVERAAYEQEFHHEAQFQPRQRTERAEPRELSFSPQHFEAPQHLEAISLPRGAAAPAAPPATWEPKQRRRPQTTQAAAPQVHDHRSAYAAKRTAQSDGTPSYFHARDQYAAPRQSARSPQAARRKTAQATNRTRHVQQQQQQAHRARHQHAHDQHGHRQHAHRQQRLPQAHATAQPQYRQPAGFAAPVVSSGLNPRVVQRPQPHQHAAYQQVNSGYLSQQNHRASQPVQRVQYETAQPMVAEPYAVFTGEGEQFEAPVGTTFAPEYESYGMAESYTMAGTPNYGHAGCVDCGDMSCYGNCSGQDCYSGGGDPFCNCNGCTTRRFCGRHPDSRFKSDYAFADFIEPITNPYWFIDPRSMTRARLVVISQDIPQNDLTPSGDMTVTSLQGSLAINERLSFVAAKTGRSTIDIDGQSEREGWLDMALGFKSVFIRDEYNRFLLSGGAIYERSNGTSEIYQGNGNGMFHVFLTGGKGYGRSHFLSTVGYHLPNNHDEENESIYYSFHYDIELFCDKFLVWEINGQHYTESGSRTPNSNVEGGDLFSLGSDNVTGNNVITTAIGTTIRLRDDIHLTAAYEVPLTNRKDFLDDRVTITLGYYY